VADKLQDSVVFKSRFLQVVALDTGNHLCLHTLQQARVVLKPEVLELLDSFDLPRRVGDWAPEYARAHGLRPERVLEYVRGLMDAKLLYTGTPESEAATYRTLLSQLFGRDPETARLASLRWASQQVPRFAAPAPRDLESMAPLGRRLDLVLVGLCEVQVGMDVLRSSAREAGLDLHLVPTFETAIEMLQTTPHDAVVVGPLGARLGLWHPADGGGDLFPERYTTAMRGLLERLRDLTKAPIIVHNLPVPTCTPLGFADRGTSSVRERARTINRELVEIADLFPDVFILDVDAALSFEGKRRLLDDRVVSSAHLGGLGWWMLLPAVELNTVHGVRPPLERLTELGVSDPFEFDRVVVADLVALLAALFGVGRRKCVIVDLDGTLWPGVLADTKSPFPARLDYTTLSYHAFFLGVHEALKALQHRGILLAGMTAGDEAILRRLWAYPSRSPLDRLMRPEDFMTLRINHQGPADNVRSLLLELEAEAGEAVFVSANPEARDRVATELPGVLVLGENPFRVRGELLTHPSLQMTDLREESAEHAGMVKGLFERERARRTARDPAAFVASLGIRCRVRRRESQDLDRVYDLVLRTSQFNTTARRFTRNDLGQMAAGGSDRRLYTLWAEDRFTDYGLVGVSVALGDTIELFLLACRVVSLGVDAVFLRCVLADLLTAHPVVKGRLVVLPDNLPARTLFGANGFTPASAGLWEIQAREAAALPRLPLGYHLEVEDIQVPTGFPLATARTPDPPG
jgi:FkbH-like protein